MRKIAIFYLEGKKAQEKAFFSDFSDLKPDEYQLLRSIEDSMIEEMDLADIYMDLQNADLQVVFDEQGNPDRSMTIGDVILVSDAEGVYDGYQMDHVGFVDLDPEMTVALAARWATRKTEKGD